MNVYTLAATEATSAVYAYSDAYSIGYMIGALSHVFSLAVSVLSIVSLWMLFNKAGDAGWKSLIPFYNLYTQFKLTWKTSMFWVMLLCVLIGPVLGVILVVTEAEALVVLGVLAIIGGVITALVLGIISYVKLGKAYGKSSGFCVGLVFLPVIFQCIMAFDKNTTYIGPQ